MYECTYLLVRTFYNAAVQKQRAGSHYRRFCRELFTRGTKICQHTSFPTRPLICAFFKISKSAKKHQLRWCA